MKFLKNKFKANKSWIIAAFVNWLLLLAFQTDRLFFSYDRVNFVMIVVKVLALCLLEFIWISVGNLLTSCKQGNSYTKRFISIWALYSFLICALLFFLWPGTWSWDDLWTLEAAQYYRLMPWQHILSSFELMILLQITPFIGGCILLKNLLIAGIVAYSICKIEFTFKLKQIFPNHYWLDILFKLIPFLLPPIVLYQLSGYRIGLYIYLELLMFVVMVASIKGTYRWSSFRVFVFSILIGVCACWRTESILYVLLGIIFFALSHNFSLTIRNRIMGVLLVIICSASIIFIQNKELGNDNYKLISSMRPSVELIRKANIKEDAKNLALIDKVLDVNIVKAHPSHDGEFVFWNDKAIKNYSKKDFNNYLKATFNLALKYPDTFWRERWQLFLNSTGLTSNGAVNNVRGTISIYQINSENNKALNSLKSKYKYSFFPKIRAKLINIMGIEKGNIKIQPLHGILWNSITPIVALLLFWIGLIFKREWQLFLLISFLIVKIPIIFLTAPSNWYMYYLSFYLFGYILIDFFFTYKFGFRQTQIFQK